jgi:hypothetical protein
MLAVARVLRYPRYFLPVWLVWAYLLIGPSVAAAAPSVIADFDGDRQPDRAELSHREPSAVRIWLSTTRRTSVVRSSSPILSIAARDLDGDRRAELIATKASTGLQVWTARRHGFAAFNPKRVTLSTLSPPTCHSVDDCSAEAAEATDQRAPDPPVPSLPSQACAVASTAARVSTRIVVIPESSDVFAPLSPRPPPLSL